MSNRVNYWYQTFTYPPSIIPMKDTENFDCYGQRLTFKVKLLIGVVKMSNIQYPFLSIIMTP
ncbi:MAG: hypothetical protein KDE33_20540 [Bacteroidetes bacterium]|nr:hypothetical protein [Bacteroidota bacterium]